MSATRFIADFEDSAKVAALIKGEEDEDSAHEAATRPEAHTSRCFSTLDEAVAWAKERVVEHETFYGLVEVSEYESVPLAARCKYCFCRGNRCIRYHVVSDDGIEGTHSNDECADD